MDISRLDKETQDYIKDLEHYIEVQNELIDSLQKIIDYQKIQMDKQQEYTQKICDTVNKAFSFNDER